MKHSFRNTCLFFAVLFFSVHLYAQQNHFIYLQTENKQPFYIRLNKKLFSSSASGYLIIPKLQDGNHTLTLGFPRNEWPEQNLTCSIDKKDAGYILKNFGDKGWGLFNWQSMNVVMADKKDGDPVVTSGISKEAITKVPTPAAEAVKATTPAAPAPVKPAAAIAKIIDSKSAEGVELVFVDTQSGSADTIRVFIPVEKRDEGKVQAATNSQPVVVTPVQKEEKTIQQDVQPPVAVPVIKEEVKNDPTAKVLQQVNETPVKEKELPAAAEKPSVTPKPLLQNSDCKALAGEEDFLKLRKKMAAETNDDDMVSVARKVFKTKCFTVEQVKNLGVLFLKDDGRYKFFDAAYPFVSDSYNFNSLVSLLSDAYFINRFKAMLRH